jgi:filamentous hemagglutinin family protein
MKNSWKRHTSSYTTTQRVWALVLILSSSISPAVSSAAMFPGLIGRTVLPYTPPAGTLPTGFNIPNGGAHQASDGTTMTITQNEGKDKVIINWDSFNIGSAAAVRFYQGSGTPGTADWRPNSNYAALNRIGNASPTVINGSLTADGKVYLINRNGVFFGPQGKVQVQSLVASAFDMSDDDFKAGLLRFGSASDSTMQAAADAVVSNEGEITTGYGGSVFLVGPKVQNLGRISAPSGKIDLIGLQPDGQVKIKEISEARNADMDVTFTDQSKAIGDVANMKGGELNSVDGGWIGMYGNTVRNDGIIRAVTSRSKNGIVYLLGRDLVATGAGSSIDVEVNANNDEKMGRSQTFIPGVVKIAGLPDKAAPLARIDHEGSITAHGGDVSMEASERVYLGSASSIDVSGLSLERPMTDQFIEVQLNSLNLLDDYGQKDSKLILGNKVWVDVSKGSTIGNLSGYYLGMDKSAQELSTSGGRINIGASTSQLAYSLGDIIISKGAAFNLSGGRTVYSGQAPATAKLIGADGRVYDISSAPKWMKYTGVFGSTIRKFGKFGSESLQGVSFGGHLMKLTSNVADRVVGSDAGSLTLRSQVIAGLDDDLSLKAAVTRGYLQTASTVDRKSDDFMVSQNRGLENPLGGKVVIGNGLSTNFALGVNIDQDAATHGVAIRNRVVQNNSSLSADGALLGHTQATEISAAMLTRANLSVFEINANTSIVTDNGANIVLRPGGSYIARGRRVEFLGAILTPGGSVEMSIQPTITSHEPTSGSNPLFDGTVRETIYLGSNSTVSTAGEQIDNSVVGVSPFSIRKGGYTTGGSIVLRQLSGVDSASVKSSTRNENSVIVTEGARLDVSGGYLINEKGTIAAGNAGSLKIQAHTISLGGDLRGHSLPGKNGGEVVLHAQEVRVVAPGTGQQLAAGFGINDLFPDDTARFQAGRLVLAADRFADTGFSRISLLANDNLTVASGVTLTPSSAKRDVYGKAQGSSSVCTAGSCFSREYPNPQDQTGNSSITLNAGVNVYGSNFHDSKNTLNNLENAAAVLTLSSGSIVSAVEGGKVTLAAPLVEIAGTVRTPGNDVTVTASRGDLVVRDGALINASGYNKQGLVTKAGQTPPLPTAMAGGKITLTASAGNLVVEKNAHIDVTGVDRTDGLVRDSRGKLTPVAVAGDAGSLELSYASGLTLDGTIAGKGGNLPGTSNGNLTVKNSTEAMTLSATDVNRYQASGFDALAFSSPKQITLPANLTLNVGRSLTLKAPKIQGTGTSSDSASITAPWITLIGTNVDTTTITTANASGSSVGFYGTYLDLRGGLLMDGFSTVGLQAGRDLTLAESYYKSDNGSDIAQWNGYLKTDAATLIMQANRIYTATAVDTISQTVRNFTVTSPSSYTISTPGKVITLPGQAANRDLSPIYSAGGNLTIAAKGGIDHRGFIAAPQGSVTLDGGSTGKVELAESSVITTAATTAVPYGAYNGSQWWDKYVSDNIKGSEVTAAPTRMITLKGKDIIVQTGAVQDLSGGGSVYGSNWQPGIPGSKNPLTISGRYVILPDGSANRPGDSIYLEAMPFLGLKGGLYSILPIEYAFIPGALVVQDTGKQLLSGQRAVSTERYPVVGGYKTTRETSEKVSGLRTGFSVRRAEDVLREGDFSDSRSFANGNGGDFNFQATGIARFDGDLKLAAQPGYKTGNASFTASAIEILAAGTAQDPASTNLQLDAKKISDLRIGTLTLGNCSDTATVTVQDNAVLTAESVTLAARDGVILKGENAKTVTAGAQVSATSGYATIRTPNGTVTMGDGASLKASNGGVVLDINNAALDAKAAIDAGTGGTFAITANGVVFDSETAQDGYFHMSLALEELFSSYHSFTIASRGDMVFKRDVNLTTGSLTVDAARYLNDGAVTVAFTAKNISLLNSSATHDTSKSPLSGGSGSLSLKGDSVTVAPRQDGTKGNIAFDRFGSVKINSKNDMVFKGIGAMTAGGDLELSAARITTAGDRYKSDKSYSAAAITIDGRNGAVTLNGSTSPDGKAGTVSTPGGSLQVLGRSITQNGGTLEVAAGQVGLTATHDIVVKGTISATCSEQVTASGEKVYYNGGSIALQSDSGMVDLQGGAVLDVSAAAVTDKKGKVIVDGDNKVVRRGNAGAIALTAATAGNGVSIAKDTTDSSGKTVPGAQLFGKAGNGGKGGSFDIDSATLAASSRPVIGADGKQVHDQNKKPLFVLYDGAGGLNGLAETLAKGGFNETVTIRSRGGDLTLSGGATLKGREVQVAADNGSITISGVSVVDQNGKTVNSGGISADTADGKGRIELYADGKITLKDKATLSAKGTNAGSHGGTVIIGSQDGSDNGKTFNGDYALNINSGSVIETAGNGGAGGTVHFRAYQGKKDAASTGLDDVNVAAIGGTIAGAGRVEVEAVKAERFTVDTTILPGDLTGTTGYVSAARLFSSTNGAAIKQRLGAVVTNLQGGVELVTDQGKNLTIGATSDATAIDLNTAAEPIVLTLKSGKDLTINQKIVDAPTALATLHSSTMKKTAAINLVAGSDGGANLMGVRKGSALTTGNGDLTIVKGTWVYTENAPIRFAAGNDAHFKGTASAPNTMINNDMKYNLGSYGGEIRGAVGRDLNLTATGSAIQSALGDISIRTGRDLNLGTAVNTGAIRTTGEYNSGTTGKTELAPGLNELLALPQMAGLLNPDYTPTNGKKIVNPGYKNPFIITSKVLEDLAALVYANGGSNIGAANVPVGVASYWTYHDGGNIAVASGRSVNGNLNASNGWDGTYIDGKYFPNGKNLADKLTPWYLTAGFGGSKEKIDTTRYTSANIPVTVGIATMAGGDVSVTAGGSLQTQVGAFGAGDVSVSSGSDMNGRFRITNGAATMISGGSYGTAANPVVSELSAARMIAVAVGDVQLGTVLNPDNTRDHVFFGTNNQKLWNMTYSDDSRFSAASLSGSAVLNGTNPYYGYTAYANSDSLGLSFREIILPTSFALSAARDVDIMRQFVLAPSQTGNLEISAGGSIRGTAASNGDPNAGFIMQDVDIPSMYGRQAESSNSHFSKLGGDTHYGINHLGDQSSVKVSAGENIDHLVLKLNKPAEVLAGGNVDKIKYVGQNLDSDSVTSIKAGGSIDQGITLEPRDKIQGTLNPTTPTIELGGPGTLLVQTGGNLRLGNSGGINSVGNINNSSFSGSGKQTDSDVIVVAGVGRDILLAKVDVQSLFNTIKTTSSAVSTLKADGNDAEADRVLAEAEQKIRKYFYFYDSTKTGTGNIDLVDSVISSRSGDIYAMAGSSINVGKTSLSNAPLAASGITTLYGGALGVYAGGNINVNESRLMTYMGGDITIWSDQGDINAGRGSKTVVSAPTPVYTFDSNGVLLAVNYTPPSAGSGIRALTFDVDGSGPLVAPAAGNIDVYAKGTLDAGEAGIQGGKLMIAASSVLNSQNITAGVGSVGVPSSNQNSVSIGPMSGASDMTNDKKMIETISGGGGEAAKKSVLAQAEDFLMKYLDVKVVDLTEGTL